MMPLLKSITVRDFRSIRGEISLSLDAPVVLIHGQNGVGKTSILSALELALTGQVPSLRALDARYMDHLLHKEAAEGRIMVSAAGVAEEIESADLAVRPDGVFGTGLLPPLMARFYSER